MADWKAAEDTLPVHVLTHGEIKLMLCFGCFSAVWCVVGTHDANTDNICGPEKKML